MCFFFRKCFAVLGFVLLFFWLCVSVQGCGFPFWLVYFWFLFGIFLIFYFCCSHPVFGEKLLLHRGFGKFGKSLYTYGFHVFFNCQWVDWRPDAICGGWESVSFYIVGTLRSNDATSTRTSKNPIGSVGKTCMALFLHFFWRFCTTRTWKCLILRFKENINKWRRNFTSLSELGYGS